ncbi:MAG TPA: FAD-binding protein [Verrucomicrobiota bacterium]|nr:2-hydroxy-acid oxidase [Verrucomicrobiales bacterium]HRI13623.1 FAD-binding protein [Verrucomicrobiota bacterium]
MNPALSPRSLTELADAIRSAPRVLAIGAGTKPRLSAVEATRVSTANLRGILEYDPSEFTFTALAGTRVSEVAAALAERGQHLPFDPLLVESGSTLGGAVASGLSGPGRFRFGGVRDFILSVRFVDGRGRLLRLGGKVVKNAAGFDLPKFFVGSLGRFGALGEITFKVFPQPASALTLGLRTGSFEVAARILAKLARSRWEPEALDIPPGGHDIHVQLGGPRPALVALAREILESYPGEVIDHAHDEWTDLREFRWAHPDGVLVKVPLSLDAVPALARAIGALTDSKIHFSSGGNVAYLSVPHPETAEPVAAVLTRLGLTGLTLRGQAPLFLGAVKHPAIETAVKMALDPDYRFPSLDD